MSDWLEQLSELEQRAKMLQGQASRIYEHPDDHDTDTYCLARDVDTFVDDMQPVIDRARRAEELERENESRYSDREAFLADANLMIQEKTRIMHEVQQLTTQMPPAALKFMGYALIDAGRNP